MLEQFQANHDSTAARALSETLAMERAVQVLEAFLAINNCSPSMQAVLEAVDMTETLVLVTADHSHTLSLGGYPGRGADITGVEIVLGLLSFLKLVDCIFGQVSVADSGWVFKAEDGQGLPVL